MPAVGQWESYFDVTGILESLGCHHLSGDARECGCGTFSGDAAVASSLVEFGNEPFGVLPYERPLRAYRLFLSSRVPRCSRNESGPFRVLVGPV
jgi:hypothetical protein